MRFLVRQLGRAELSTSATPSRANLRTSAGEDMSWLALLVIAFQMDANSSRFDDPQPTDKWVDFAPIPEWRSPR
jgi:hypothetical protein